MIKLSYINAGRVRLIGSLTYPMLRDATLATLFDILNANFISYDYSKGDNVLTMTDTGSRVLCRSVDEFERLRGTNLARFALDELTYTPEAAWMVLEGRLRDPKPSGCADLGSGRQKVTTGSTESSYQSRCEATTRPNRAARDWCRSFFQTLGGYGIAATGAFSIEWQHGDPTPVAGGAAQSVHGVNARARAPSYLFSSNRVIVLN
ncbi:MAG: hypothetical protein DMG58_10805 [Acidobacteria bacterium]|nr:MAG: hypothetical protein DMG58_10805 [Acidobacteriota bacterium]